jgi:hypothetical protein
MAENEGIEVETTNVAEANVARQQTGLTDVSPANVAWSVPPASLTEQGENVKTALAQPGSGAGIPPAKLTEQGTEVVADLASGRDNPWPVRPTSLSPGGQATLKAMRGNR